MLTREQVSTEIRRAKAVAAVVRIHYRGAPIDNRYTVIKMYASLVHAHQQADQLSAADDCDLEGIPPSHGVIIAN